MKHNYRLLALDIDGTLTNSDKVITRETKDAIIKLQETGVKVILASGRSEYGIKQYEDELRLKEFGSYVMSFNGGKIVKCDTKEIIYDRPLTLKDVEDMYVTAVEYNTGILGYEKDCLVSGNGIDEYQRYDALVCRMQLKAVCNFPNYFSVPFNKCLLTGEPDHMEEVFKAVKEQFSDRLSITMSEKYFIDIMPNGVSKGIAMENLAAALGLDRKQVVCVGDGLNDLSMIEYAGLGVAMANGHKEVINKADYVTASNDENGVMKVINRFFI